MDTIGGCKRLLSIKFILELSIPNNIKNTKIILTNK